MSVLKQSTFLLFLISFKKIFAENSTLIILYSVSIILKNEDKGIYVGSRTNSKYVLSQYVDEVINGIETGSFSYIAHPDVCNFCDDEAFYKSEMTKLCNAAKKKTIFPLK